MHMIDNQWHIVLQKGAVLPHASAEDLSASGFSHFWGQMGLGKGCHHRKSM